jgi:hypothetical protein
MAAKKSKTNKSKSVKKTTKKATPSVKKKVVVSKNKVVTESKRGRKPTTRRAKRIPVSQSPRKKSDYNILSSQISEYCKKRQNGKPCTRQKIAEIYNAIKQEQTSKGKKLSQQEIRSIIESKLAFANLKSVPEALEQLDWFRVVSTLVEDSGSFFKDQDLIVFNLSEIGFGSLRTPFFNLEDYYIEEIYPTIQQYADEIEDLTGRNFNSPPPQLIYDASKSDIDKRIFTWVFNMPDSTRKSVSTKENIEEVPTVSEVETEEKPTKKSDEAEILRLRKETAEAEEKRLSSKSALISQYTELYKMDILTSEELKKLILDLS